MITPADIISKIDQHTTTKTTDIDHALRRLSADGARLFPKEIMRYMACLVTAGADINKAGGANQCTPLHWAVIKSQSRILRWLVAQPNADLLCKNAEGRSPLSISVDKKNKDIQCILLTELVRRCMADADKLMPQEWENQRITPAQFHAHNQEIENLKKIALFNLAVGCFSLAHYNQVTTKKCPAEFTQDVLKTIDPKQSCITKENQQDYVSMLFKTLQHRYAFHQYKDAGKRLSESKTAYVHAQLTNILAEADLLDKIPLMYCTLGTHSDSSTQAAPGLSLLALGSEDSSMNIQALSNCLLIINPAPNRKRADSDKIPIYSGDEKRVYLSRNILDLQQLTGRQVKTIVSISNQDYIHPRVGSTAYGQYGNQSSALFMAVLLDHFKKLWADPSYDIAPYLIDEAHQIISAINSDPKLKQINADNEQRCIAHAEEQCKRQQIPDSIATASLKAIPTIAHVEEAIAALTEKTAGASAGPR